MSDLISRQNAIEGVKELFACADIGNDECDIIYMLENLPSTGRLIGKWKQISPARIYECSKCGRMIMTGDIESYKFCHNCGARMITNNYG